MADLAGNDRSPVYCVKLNLTGSASTTGTFASIANPHGAALIIFDRVLNVTTQSTGACTLDIGVGATSSTSSDTLIDGISVASAGVLSTAGTNGGTYRTWSATQCVTVTEASGDAAGLVGTLYVYYTFA